MSETVPQSNATENNETTRPLGTHASKSAKSGGGPSCPSGVTEQEVTKELANALPQDTATSTNGVAKPSTKNGEATEVHPVPGLLPVN